MKEPDLLKKKIKFWSIIVSVGMAKNSCVQFGYETIELLNNVDLE